MTVLLEKDAPRVRVTAEQFARLSGAEALQLFVDKLERAGLSQQEMTFHLEAMASDATRLLPLRRQGGVEMARLGDEAEGLGAALDSNALAALKRTQLALYPVSLVMTGLKNRIAAAAAPAIEALASAFTALVSEGEILRVAIDDPNRHGCIRCRRGLIYQFGRLVGSAGGFGKPRRRGNALRRHGLW